MRSRLIPLILCALTFPLHAATFTVTNTFDSGAGSLRDAILGANGAGLGTHTIEFSIGSGGVQTITPLSALPPLMTEIEVLGNTQPGFAGTPLIVLDGASAPPGTIGLRVQGASCLVRGLSIVRFPSSGLSIENAFNDVMGNYIGILPDGTTAAGNWIAGMVSTV